jgi:GNAT superfamily N-acetyltransferase
MIRIATRDDLSVLLVLGRRLHQESAYRFLPFDAAKVAASAEALIAGAGYVAIAGDWGMFAGGLAEYWFSRAQYAADLCLYLAPERRRTLAGAQAVAAFIRGFRAWAQARGATELTLAVTTGIHTEATARLYERFGLVRAGVLHAQRL